MYPRNIYRRSVALCATTIIVAGATLLRGRAQGDGNAAAREPQTASPASPAANAAQEIETIKGLLPDQSSAMADVGYHFSNLWFAAQEENWPLAEFYLSETRSHLKWAVRIKPARKDPEGRDIDLPAILQAVDDGLLQPLAATLKSRDTKSFGEAYRLALERGCYQCHKTAGKPYLRPRVPVQPPQTIINFDPGAKWPE